jgi:HTTM domain
VSRVLGAGVFDSGRMRDWLALDKRSLGLLRVVLGLVLAVDVCLRGLHFRAHYTEDGMFPLRHYLVQPDLTQRRWSVFFMNDTPFFVGVLLVLFLVASLSLAVGYRTRLAGWLCWILLLGLYRRNPVVNNAGDIYLPLLIMWGNFLPWGERFSLDSSEREDSGGDHYSALPGVCYILQISILYWFSAVLRTGPEWQVDGTALYYSLNLEPLNTDLAPLLLLFGSGALVFITMVTLLLEVIGPLLLLVPSGWSRVAGVLLIISFHFGILLSLRIPVFAVVCMAAPLGLLPKFVWEISWGRKLARALESAMAALRGRLPMVLVGSHACLGSVPLWLRRFYFQIPLVFMGLTLFFLNWGIHTPDVRSPLTGVLRVLSLDQRWGMFSPRPPSSMHWESAPGRTKSGRTVNLLTGRNYSMDLAELRNNTNLWDYRWRAYLSGPAFDSESHAQLFLRYLVRQWDVAHPEDPMVSAQCLYHPRTIPKRFLLGEDGVDVITVYHR